MPVFIVGFARSGTTLCQRLVAERFKLRTLPETHFFERLGKYHPEESRLTSANARALLEELRPYLDMNPATHEPLLAQPEVSVRALFLSLVEEQTGHPRDTAAGRWLEKTPMHVLSMPVILGLFPQARFIAMLRNPLTAFASRRELSEPGKGWGEEWKPIEYFCREWRLMLDKLAAFEADHGEHVLRMRLEDLSDDTETQIERIGKFLGKAPTNVARTKPLATRIVQPFETWKTPALSAVDPALAQRAGRSGLDAYETWRVQQLLGQAMAGLGYDEPAAPAPVLDDLHRRLIASVDWYRDALQRAHPNR